MFEVPGFILSTTSKQGEEQKEEADVEKEKRKKKVEDKGLEMTGLNSKRKILN